MTVKKQIARPIDSAYLIVGEGNGSIAVVAELSNGLMQHAYPEGYSQLFSTTIELGEILAFYRAVYDPSVKKKKKRRYTQYI